MDEKQAQKKIDRTYWIFAFKIIIDFGLSIAIPIILFVLPGQWLDSKYSVSPWFTILAFVLAALCSGKIIYKKTKAYGKQYQEIDKK